jgi:tRNA uridine 5-carboxymethylaminomethyl modification enzyme
VITTGTFLNGRIWLGQENWPAGRADDPAATGLAQAFARFGFRLGKKVGKNRKI